MRRALLLQIGKLGTGCPFDIQTGLLRSLGAASDSATEVQVKAWLKFFLTDDSGATSIEFAMIALIMSFVVIAGAQGLGLELSDLYHFFSDEIVAAMQGRGSDD